MSPKVYIETSIVSYFTARPNRDLIVAARQQITHEAWPRLAGGAERFISALVIQEARRGDADAAAKRLAALAGLPVLEMTAPTQELARALVLGGAIPVQSEEDALHIAIAAVNGMDFLLTWNFTHINNAFKKARIIEIIENFGLDAPVLCSPEELIGDLP